ncbi:LytTR family DNA-binding domain-containing protein [Caulobacter endophyticus]|uniref:LytTR family DNA-binding domain-containing protein n=1 Tax=Caulobacter endophyticus TaxID=2172652 RepID=UPI0024103F9D|nr:LytTR family DNA-binding domain-containing protein [Caulobacter endophyticus]MDG2528349.1 LytTR family DNA-binding domain-containing protein [Caulobacter endophyticus]
MAALAARHGRGILVAGVAGLFLAFAGAFGTSAAPLWIRVIYWLVLCWSGAAAGAAVGAVVQNSGLTERRPFVGGAVITLGVALPGTLYVWAMSSLMFGALPRTANLPHYFLPVLVITAAITALNFLVARRPIETRAAAAEAPPPRFLERLPPKLRGARLYAVEAQDHYLRLHTSRGEDLILMRLSDAVAELEGIEGAQTHRSWWVARAAVVEARRGDGRAVLTLAGGAEAPVSRAYAKALREAGWF